MPSPAVFFSFIWRQWTESLPYPSHDWTGKTVIVTGANIGLGFEAAKHFSRLNAKRVILACRSPEKGEAAKKEIEHETKRTGAVEVWQLDLANFDSVKAFARRCESIDRIDAVVENAGINTMKFSLSEGYESTLTVNVIGTFLLALLLLPTLKRHAQQYNFKPNLVIVSSEVHMFTDFPERKISSSENIFKAMSDKNTARQGDRYNVSKLLEVLSVRAFTGKMTTGTAKVQAPKGEYPVIINYLNPGLCHSGLMREMSTLGAIVKFILHARSTEVGSRTLVHAASAGPETHGEYLSGCGIAPTSSFVASKESAEVGERVWRDLSSILEGIESGVTKNF